MSKTATLATATTWAIDASHSHVAFAVRHLMISTVRGQFTDVNGVVVLDEEQPSNSRVEVTVGIPSIETREPQRDAHLRSADFFDAERFPTMTFVSRKITGSLDGSFALAGDLTIRGVSHEVVLDAQAEGLTTDPWGGRRAGFSATGKISRSAFGLTWNQALETGGVVVGDEVKITLDVELVQQQASA